MTILAKFFKDAIKEDLVDANVYPFDKIQIKKEPGKRGRPKVSNKKKQYTLTMNPDLYKTLSELAKENYKSFSQLVTDACIEYIKKQ